MARYRNVHTGEVKSFFFPQRRPWVPAVSSELMALMAGGLVLPDERRSVLAPLERQLVPPLKPLKPRTKARATSIPTGGSAVRRAVREETTSAPASDDSFLAGVVAAEVVSAALDSSSSFPDYSTPSFDSSLSTPDFSGSGGDFGGGGASGSW